LARDWHADPSAADSGNGSLEHPFSTANAAVAKASPGERVLLAPGIYRELVVVRVAGTAENPIVIESADPKQPAILTGADPVSNWKPLASSDLPEATLPEARNIFFADINWTPKALFAGATEQPLSREPESGWWMAHTTDGKTISSDGLASVHATSLRGADIFFFRAKGVAQQTAAVKEWTGNAPGSSLELETPLFRGQSVTYTDGDRFYLKNSPALISRKGEWATVVTDVGTRLFWWPPDIAALDRAEAPRRESVLDLSGASHIVIRNLQTRQAAVSPSGFGIGLQNAGVADHEDFLIEGCSVYQNQRFGVSISGARKVTMKNCLVVDNSNGVVVSRSRDILIENNEIAWNHNDGLIFAWDLEDAVVRGNIIHHHSRFAHPDNFQTYRGVKNVLLDSNLIVASCQGAHTQQTVDLVARNNIFAGTSANMFHTSGPDKKNTRTEKPGGGYVLENNTFTLFANGAVIVHGAGHKMSGNLFDLRGGKYAYSANVTPQELQSTNNHFSPGNNPPGLLATFSNGQRTEFRDLAQMQTATGLEAGSSSGDPEFASAPSRIVSLDGDRIAECTTEKLVYEGRDAFSTGDHVEFDFDGVDRVVREAGASHIVIAPPLAAPPVTTVLVANWDSHPVGKIDLPPRGGRGSTVPFEAYFRGDFNNDGVRDVPPWPEGITPPRAPGK